MNVFTWPPKWLQTKATKKPLEERVVKVLEDTRDWFVNTHWTSGTLYKIGVDGKKHFCAVGGFCQVLLDQSGVEDADELPGMGHSRFNPSQTKQLGESILDAIDLKVLDAVFAAERELAITVNPWEAQRYEGRLVSIETDREDEVAENERMHGYEGIIITWNDGGLRNSQRIVDGFNMAIDRVREHGLSERPFVASATSQRAA